MKAAYIEMIGGGSGNMLAAAFVDAGADLDTIERALRTIPVEGWTIERSRVERRGIAAIYLDFVIPGEDDHHGHPQAEEYDRHRIHRTLADVLDLIAASGLSASQKTRVGKIYTRLAEAEARAHGTDVRVVHFHEVGQIDAILDVAASCVALDLLGIDRLFCSPYPIGRGMISMHHGRYPNPPPATAELMRGAPTFASDVDGEMVTTTAAAILSTLVDDPGRRPAMRWEALGYGAGRSNFPIPNVTRVILGELLESSPLEGDRVVIVEANIDDMSPQHFELAQERLFAAGALDVWTSAVSMKKSRPGVLLSAMASPDKADACARAMLRETTTLGVRMHDSRRLVVQREISTLPTPIGEIRVKRASIDGTIRTSLEYEDVVRIARERGAPIASISRDLARYVEALDGSRD